MFLNVSYETVPLGAHPMFRTIYTELGWDPIHDKKTTRMEFQVEVETGTV